MAKIEWRSGLRYGISTMLMLFFLLHATGLFPIPFLATLENQAYDLRLKLTAPHTTDPRVVILDIDENSLKKVGRWPWDRDIIAALMNDLFDFYGIQVLGFDVLFAEEDRDAGLDIMDQLADGPLKDDAAFRQTLEQIRPQLERDRILAESFQNRPVVLGYYFKNRRSHGDVDLQSGNLPTPALSKEMMQHQGIPFLDATGYGANLPILQQAAMSGGFIDMPFIDDDGIIRRLPLVQEYDGELYGTLSLSIVRALLGNPPLQLTVAPGLNDKGTNLGLEWIEVGGFRIPVDEYGAAMINYLGPFPSFPYVSAIDVLTHKAPKEVLEGTIVLVGTTAAGLLDMRSTPMQAVYPGVEVHANMVLNILDESFKERPVYVRGIDSVLLLGLSTLLILLLPRLSLTMSFLVAISTLAAVAWINIYSWTQLNLIVPIVSQALSVSSIFIVHIFMQVFVENRSKKQLARVFGQYVPPELVDEMSRHQEGYGMEGETREMTVLFSDIRGFTNMSENMEPKQLTLLMNEYLTEMTSCVHHHRGTIDKYIGDALMAFWGAPLSDPQHARNALLSSMEMIERLPEVNARFEEKGWKPINIGIGLNTGKMNVGNMGSRFRMSYTVLGDAVNLGSRLESLTKRYGVSIIVSESVAAQVPELHYRELDLVRVVGKKQPITIYEPLASDLHQQAKVQEELGLYETALSLYRQQRWLDARTIFTDLIMHHRGRLLYQMYIGRCVHFLKEPPPEDWDGVYNISSK
ncbi:MAG: adenylate/guanylate cyclase domain-containing protein [Gammaproteobacteria bacterium]|nr:adenylate/guanylate cyclase domain-containing protein [Gammaproteobacteria bacterium]